DDNGEDEDSDQQNAADPTASGRAWLLVGVFDRISLIGAGLVGVVRSWRRDKRLRGGLWPLLLRLLLLLCCSGGVHGHGSCLLFLGEAFCELGGLFFGRFFLARGFLGLCRFRLYGLLWLRRFGIFALPR